MASLASRRAPRPRKATDKALSRSSDLLGWTGSRSRRAAVAAVLMGVLSLVSGCESDQAVVWQADAVSPDGGYTVHAETIQQSGPGNAWIWTTVKLTQKGQKTGVDILGLSHDLLPRPPGYAVQMRWLGPRRLRLAWAPGSEVNFQAVRAITVDIEAGPGAGN